MLSVGGKVLEESVREEEWVREIESDFCNQIFFF